MKPSPDVPSPASGELAVTPSESYLARLCRQAFLYLWSYSNLYRDEGRRGDGHGKELCDLLVVFGDDLFIFSDKHCDLRAGSDPKVAWSRWYRAAILKSGAQVLGAERWLAQRPDGVFLDRSCRKPLPIRLPARPAVYRILTCRGSAAAAQGMWGGRGSLLVTNKGLEECATDPLHLGAFDDRGRMFHVFDEIALDVVLRTLDTISDFRDYLVKREAFFRLGSSILAAGEEELLGLYLRSISKDGTGHDFVVEGVPTYVAIDEGFWDVWLTGPERAAKLAADRISYSWDLLIEKFAHHMLKGTQYFSSGLGVKEEELILRWMARESRFRRRMLADSLIQAIEMTSPGKLRRRYLPPGRSGDPYWVFLVLPRPDSVPYEKYREVRRELLLQHCYVVKYLNPEALDIVGIAVEANIEKMSEDAIYLDARQWTTDNNAEGRRLHEEEGIFRDARRLEVLHSEFPVSQGR